MFLFKQMTSLATKKIIATHSGSFHADEAMACWFLQQLPEYHDAQIVRTRDLAVIAQADVAVDVGAEYDHSRSRFDHHQRGFEETFSPEHGIKLSSAGLVYKHFGREVIGRLSQLPLDDSRVDLIWNRLYQSFVMALDAIDNGVTQYAAPEDSQGVPLQPRYKISTDLASRVGRLNPSWACALKDDADHCHAQFLKAVALTGGEFVEALESFRSDWFLAREIVRESLEQSRAELQGGGAEYSQVLVLHRACPWKSHLFDFEAEHGIQGLVKYVIYCEHATSWRIQAVPVHIDTFGDRLSLPEPWRGVRDEALSAAVGLQGCIFVHASGFIGGATSRETVLGMALKALNFSNRFE